MNATFRATMLVATLVLTACDSGPKGSAGFTLPDGDVQRGKATYVELQCNACHDISAVPQMPVSGSTAISVPLGGETTQVKTYGQLVTSIINPSHRIARSRFSGLVDEQGASLMINYNDLMTITQLIDLVAFVQSTYELLPFQYSVYPIYPIPTPGKGLADPQQ